MPKAMVTISPFFGSDWVRPGTTTDSYLINVTAAVAGIPLVNGEVRQFGANPEINPANTPAEIQTAIMDALILAGVDYEVTLAYEDFILPALVRGS